MDSILSHLTSSLFQSDRIYNETSTPAPEEQTETTDPVVEKPPEEDGAEIHEEDEEEPEDPAPVLRDECAATAACAPLKQHFDHCTERVVSGKGGFKHEDCVEELFHMMHCVDNCIAPKLFSKLA